MSADMSLSGSLLLAGSSTSGSSVARSTVFIVQGLRVGSRRLCLVGLRVRLARCGIGIDIHFLGVSIKDVGAARASGLRVKLLYSSAFLSTVAGAEASGSRIRDAVMLSELSADKKTSLTDGDD